MFDFGIHFLICNIFISIFIGIMTGIKHLLRKCLSARMQYRLWSLLLSFMAVPFLPANIFSILKKFPALHLSDFPKRLFLSVPDGQVFIKEHSAIEKVNDFAVSISSKTSSPVHLLLFSLWAVGAVTMFVLAARSFLRLRTLEQSALPLQNQQVKRLYENCCKEMHCKKKIPIYSTAFLKSPVTVGLIHPRIYLPIHLISDFNAKDMRFMLLHELQHCRQKDTRIVFLMNLAGILYWFNPFVWYALKEMRCDRELSCDSAVLHLLDETDYQAYGNTLINFAEKISHIPFPYATGMSGSMKQIKRRILNIAAFQKETKRGKARGFLIYILIAFLSLSYAPVLAAAGSPQNEYRLPNDMKNISTIDLSNHFNGYQGSFVLYDTNQNAWNIFNIENAKERIAPNSTYKIYDALLGLESGIITPEDSDMTWNGEDYPFDAWEANQTLSSAMKNSVNWYFQSIDSQLGFHSVKSFLQKIQYGNQQTGSDIDLYWTDLSLKISPIEQVNLLKKFHDNEFQFAPQNIDAVKNSILLSSGPKSSLYGKTGTGRIDGKDVNGWFIGFLETADNVYYFATNIQGETETTGSKATEITTSVLSELNIGK